MITHALLSKFNFYRQKNNNISHEQGDNTFFIININDDNLLLCTMDDVEAQNIIESITVPPLPQRLRLSDYAPGIFKNLPSNKATKKAIKKGLVYVNGKQGYTGDFVVGGETLILLKDQEQKVLPAVKVDVKVCYEDDYLAVVDKPAGLVVSGNKHRTLENGLATILQRSPAPDALWRPEPIHRLDYPTSGAVLFGKTKQAVILLNKIFEERRIIKKYLAITIGQQDEVGEVTLDVEGKTAKSAYQVKASEKSERFGCLNLVELTLFSGRRHQLRIHLSSIGHPILGDSQYGQEGLVLKGKGLYLHAYSMEFVHPFFKESLRVQVDPPKKFFKLFPNI
ncbi:ribosomal large subunit pseudouridine synthase C [Saccharicrinis fermentans DSM 9555 = JCM 21142]|uniref:Ribosomal large subunit pseudouridine synthase C n=2 Tax=Saccharicrinis fermentans TaxID=982 RepID=W7Y5Z3_9BACT|nr:ribosomal large subunit pseudouridine synthase C [Saccharicrinis fermentans DSM 9555 = JCM 21142]